MSTSELVDRGDITSLREGLSLRPGSPCDNFQVRIKDCLKAGKKSFLVSIVQFHYLIILHQMIELDRSKLTWFEIKHVFLPQGYCDVFLKCRQVDAEGPLVRLKNLLFNQETLLTIAQWVTEYWWAVLLMGVGFVILMASGIRYALSEGLWRKVCLARSEIRQFEIGQIVSLNNLPYRTV